MLNCKKVCQLLEEERDQKLSLTNQARLKLHLFLCIFCRRYKKRINLISQLLRIKEENATECLSVEAKEKIQSNLDKELKQ